MGLPHNPTGRSHPNPPRDERGSCVRSTASRLLLVALLLAGSSVAPRPSFAQTTEDLQQISSRLRALGPLEPLPDSSRNRDVGEIAVIEHDGSSYDRKLPDGTSNYEERARVGLRFYEAHPDDYDFVVVFTNF